MSKAEDGDFSSPVKNMKTTKESPISITPISRRSPRLNPHISVSSPRKIITRSSCSPSENKEIVDAEEMNILAEKKIEGRRKLQLHRRIENKNEEGKTQNMSTEKQSISSVQSKEQGTLTEQHELHQGSKSNNDTISEQVENEVSEKSKKHQDKEIKKVSKPTTTTYRSGMTNMVEVFKEFHDHKVLREEHDIKMKKTPFAAIYTMFRDRVFTLRDVRKPSNIIQNVLKTYSNKDDMFEIAGKKVKLKVEDMAVVFGLQAYGKIKIQKQANRPKSDFVDKYGWNGLKYISNATLIESLRSAVRGEDDNDVDDFCRILILLIISTIFQCGNGSGVSMMLVSVIEDLDSIGDIGWASYFHEELMEQVRNWDAKKPFTITNCAVLIVYFLLEHTNIKEEKKITNPSYPRAAKWSFIDLGKKHLDDIRKLQNVQVKTVLQLNAEELLLVQKSVEGQGLETEEKNEYARKLKEAEEKLDNYAIETELLNDRIEILQKSENEAREKVLLLQDTERTAKMKIIMIEMELKDTRKLLEAEMMEKQLVMEEVKKLKEENKRLLDSNSEMVELLGLEMHENAVLRNNTPKVASPINTTETPEIKGNHSDVELKNTPKVNSKIKKIKEKERKRKEDSEYVYEPLKKPKKGGASSSAAEIMEVDANGNEVHTVSPAPPRIAKRLPDVTRSEYYKFLTHEEKKKIQKFFKNGTESSIAWENKDTNLVILGLDLKKILFDEFISERIIDWFAYDLQRSAVNSSSSDQYKAEIFPSGLCVCLLQSKEQLAEKKKYLKREIDEKIIELNFKDTEALIFPMIHHKTNQDKTGIHWTLLVCDTTDWSWSHYDSSPRKSRSMSDTKRDATKLQQRVNSALCKLKNLTNEEKNKLQDRIETVTCPNQGKTVNSGLYVCMFMESLFVKKSQPTSLTNEEGAKLVERLKWTIPLKILQDNNL